MNSELIAKAKEAKSAEELLAMAKENDIEITGEQAKEYYDRLHASGELADDELDSISGGGCYTTNPGHADSNCWNGKFVSQRPTLSRKAGKCMDCIFFDPSAPNSCMKG